MYEELHGARREMENRIKEEPLDLFADRTSPGRMRSNQLRLSSPPLPMRLSKACDDWDSRGLGWPGPGPGRSARACCATARCDRSYLGDIPTRTCLKRLTAACAVDRTAFRKWCPAARSGNLSVSCLQNRLSWAARGYLRGLFPPDLVVDPRVKQPPRSKQRSPQPNQS